MSARQGHRALRGTSETSGQVQTFRYEISQRAALTGRFFFTQGMSAQTHWPSTRWVPSSFPSTSYAANSCQHSPGSSSPETTQVILVIFAQRSSGHHAQGCKTRADRLPFLARHCACSPINGLMEICDNEGLCARPINSERRDRVGHATQGDRVRPWSIRVHAMRSQHSAMTVICCELVPIFAGFAQKIDPPDDLVDFFASLFRPPW